METKNNSCRSVKYNLEIHKNFQNYVLYFIKFISLTISRVSMRIGNRAPDPFANAVVMLSFYKKYSQSKNLVSEYVTCFLCFNDNFVKSGRGDKVTTNLCTYNH